MGCFFTPWIWTHLLYCPAALRRMIDWAVLCRDGWTSAAIHVPPFPFPRTVVPETIWAAMIIGGTVSVLVHGPREDALLYTQPNPRSSEVSRLLSVAHLIHHLGHESKTRHGHGPVCRYIYSPGIAQFTAVAGFITCDGEAQPARTSGMMVEVISYNAVCLDGVAWNVTDGQYGSRVKQMGAEAPAARPPRTREHVTTSTNG
jgi:hypothetical protein